MVAEHIGTVHHEINYTIQEGLDAIRDVIYFIETYDVTTVRASTPMYLLARVIRSMGIKMVLSGEGADEVFGGYLYFHKAPDAKAFHEETVRKLGKLYLYDCLRANKSLAAWGIEGRVPFLDKEFLDVAMGMNPVLKMCPDKTIEKKVVREAFADLLPEEVAWRQKEQFSDGVGYSWIDTLKQITASAVSDEQMAHAAERFPINPPQNKEDTTMSGATNKITALYCRLSQEDARLGESLSIENQKVILLEYAKKNHFPNPVFFVDDGYSGTNYDRPGFQSMLVEIEAGRVGIVITKDLSRLGRNSALTGLYTNFTFPQYGVRYIAINDNYDTIDPNSVNNDFAGIKNWFNEFYARDTSRKIRAVQKAKGERGVPLTVNVPYGYVKDPENPKHWLVDPEAAAIVKRIFSMCMEGRGPTQIANQLWADKVLTPTAYKLSHGRSTNAPAPEDPYRWDKRAVSLILERREYTGCTVNFKTYTNSIWDKKRHLNPVENQAIFPDTHERIIDDDVFEKVQEIRSQRHRMTRTGKSSIFSGMVYCADCGSKMQYGSSNNRDFSQDFFDCSLHKKNGSKCKGHFIRVKVLEGRVLSHVQRVTDYILRHENYFRKVMEEQLRVESSEKLTVLKKQLARNEKRIVDLKRLFMKIYEDNASGKLSDDRFDMMSQSYDAEQKQLEEESLSIQQEIEVQEQQIENIEKFVQKAHKYVHIEELTPYALRELVSAIYVDAPDKSSGKRVQHIHIKYDGLGYIPLDELEAKEKA